LRRTPARVADVRVGSSTHGLEPVSLAARQSAAHPSHWLALGAIAVAAITADQVTKHVVTSSLALGEETHVAGPLSIHYVQNSGIAFGLFGGATAFVTLFTALAVAWMLVFFARSGARHGLVPVALGFLIGGSTSNLVDRLRLGHVTDFLDLGFWPAFNLADSFIVVGVALLVLALFAAERTPRRVLQPNGMADGRERRNSPVHVDERRSASG
jgi:signal peptidase II